MELDIYPNGRGEPYADINRDIDGHGGIVLADRDIDIDPDGCSNDG